MLPNVDQVLSLVRAVLSIVGTMLMTKGVVSTVDWTTYSGAILLLVPIAWSMFVHTDTGKLKAVEAMPEVKSIVVSPIAASASADAVADSSRPKVTT